MSAINKFILFIALVFNRLTHPKIIIILPRQRSLFVLIINTLW